MRCVYIAGPITKGDLAHNINQGTDAFVALAQSGVSAFCPMWSCYSGRAVSVGGVVVAVGHPNPNELTHAEWCGLDLAWVARSDAVLRLPGESTGADLETAHAVKCGVPVFHSTHELLAWANSSSPHGAT